jgi:hypothetical protein
MVLALMLLVMIRCGSPVAPDAPDGGLHVTGTIHFFTLEGGFWAVRGDDGVTYDPMNGLPSRFQQENLRVSMLVKVRKDLAGVHMVGPVVEIVTIQRL